MKNEGLRTEQVGCVDVALVSHLNAGVNVEAHIVVANSRVVLVQSPDKLDFAQRRVGAQVQKRIVRIVEEVNRRDTVRQDVDHVHADQLVVQPVLHVKAAVSIGQLFIVGHRPFRCLLDLRERTGNEKTLETLILQIGLFALVYSPLVLFVELVRLLARLLIGQYYFDLK